MKRTYLLLIALIFLTIPTFVRMLPQGIFSMQDFPYFRLVEYSKCFGDLQIPCRWAPDAGLGYGEPVFNFYSHIPFFLGSILIQSGISAISSLKFLFALSFVGSAVAMFFLARKVWKNEWAGVTSAVLYLYAPYRAVNVWVRAALPESFAFIFLPLILFSFEKFIESRKKSWLILFSLSLAFLILTHNLSVILFAHAIIAWILVRVVQTKTYKLLIPIVFAGVLSVLLSAFYLLPSITESHLVNLQTTTLGYFDFRAHFVTIPQLFISRFWGYGGSTWGPVDGLSLSVGQVQWVLAVLSLLIGSFYLIQKKKVRTNEILTIHLVLCGIFYLFLTHNKSAFLWEAFSPVMKYIQFPWRFLGITIFSFSLASGYLITISKKYMVYVSLLFVIASVLLNVSFFKEDLWFKLTDHDLQTGNSWVEQSRASIGDYWPIFGPIPTEPDLERKFVPTNKGTNYAEYFITSDKDENITLPMTYFPGWSAKVNNNLVSVTPSKEGLISIPLSEKENHVSLKFHETEVRRIGKLLSIFSFIFLIGFFLINYDFPKKH